MFQSMLNDLLERVSGARRAMIVGIDGVLLETDDGGERPEAEMLAAEYGTFFRNCRNTACGTENGELRNCTLTTDSGKLIFQALTPEYFLVMHLAPDSFAGKAFFEISRAERTLVQELVF